MKHIKMAVALILATALAATQGIHGQTVNEFRKMPAEQKAQLLTDSLKVMLQLDNGQYDKAYTIILDAVTKAGSVAKSKDSRIAKRQKLKALLIEEEDKMKLVLTKAQFDIFQNKKQQAVAYYRRHLGEEKLVFNTPSTE